MSDLAKIIDKRIGEVRFDSIDLSFGEIVSLHNSSELIIQPEYQRMFRWSHEQRSRLVESILLELPIPQIFVIENENGVLELIDGLQRVSSVIQFMDPKSLELEPLELIGCDLITELNGNIFEALPLKLKLQLKRSAVRTVIIKRQSKSFLRYEMFKRLNTGGASLSPQEIRNCSSRMVGPQGVRFYEFLEELAKLKVFEKTISSIATSDEEQRGDEELVLRYFALKNYREYFRGSVKDWLDGYMEEIIFGREAFDYVNELENFTSIFTFISEMLGDSAFVKYRNGQPIGSLAPAYFEAVTMGVADNFVKLRRKNKEKLASAVRSTLEASTFKKFTGPGANSKPKMKNRILTIGNALLEA